MAAVKNRRYRPWTAAALATFRAAVTLRALRDES